ncbi:unnamed protein product [Fraxinus pennsylvanica]|uniref:Uncharacterized protein n=1 Tax=Fraxinus pennsylvanica TaxID=56036 RepID=A0AAD1YTV1_9LAMI|nr:unnamed protein product [Fraxinus pennsylvanica]
MAYHKSSGNEETKVLLALDGAKEDFNWPPYVRAANDFLPQMVYKENYYWELLKSSSSNEFEGLVRCLRPSELVSLEVDCIEQYLPHCHAIWHRSRSSRFNAGFVPMLAGFVPMLAGLMYRCGSVIINSSLLKCSVLVQASGLLKSL